MWHPDGWLREVCPINYGGAHVGGGDVFFGGFGGRDVFVGGGRGSSVFVGEGGGSSVFVGVAIMGVSVGVRVRVDVFVAVGVSVGVAVAVSVGGKMISRSGPTTASMASRHARNTPPNRAA